MDDDELKASHYSYNRDDYAAMMNYTHTIVRERHIMHTVRAFILQYLTSNAPL